MKKMTTSAMMQANGGRYKCTVCGYKNPTYTQAVTHYWRYVDGNNYGNKHAVMHKYSTGSKNAYNYYIKWCL